MGLSVHCAKLLRTPPTYESTYLCTFFIFFRLSLFRILPILDFKRGQKGPPSLAAELLFEDAYELLVIELSCATFTSIRQSRGKCSHRRFPGERSLQVLHFRARYGHFSLGNAHFSNGWVKNRQWKSGIIGKQAPGEW